jgi:hypothetical protein
VDEERLELRLTQETSAIRQEIAGVRTEVATLRADMATRSELEAVRQDITVVRSEMATRKEMEALRQDMGAGFTRLERQMAESRVDMIKWSFLFWTGQCFVIIGFLLVFLRNR